MKLLWPALIVIASPAWSQVDWSREQKSKEIVYHINKAYVGCLSSYEQSTSKDPNAQILKEIRREPISVQDMRDHVDRTKETIQNFYQNSLDKNPELAKELMADLEAIATDKRCQSSGNDCRTTLVATAKFYMDRMRPSLPGCELDKLKPKQLEKVEAYLQSASYNSQASLDGYHEAQCLLEKKYQDQPHLDADIKQAMLSSFSVGQKRPNLAARYMWMTVDMNNYAFGEIQMDILYKTVRLDKDNNPVKSTEVHICDPAKSMDSTTYQSPLKVLVFKEPYITAPAPKAQKIVEIKPEPKECIETYEKSKFVPGNFDEGRSDVGLDQAAKLMKEVEDFMNSTDKDIKITDITVYSSSSRTPFSIEVNGKRVIDPESDNRNLALAAQRAASASKILEDVQKTSSALAGINFQVKSELAGPAFEMTDAKLKSLKNTGSQGSEYYSKVVELFNANTEMYKTQAVCEDPKDLLDAAKYPSLYHAKFKPFQGYRIVISGHYTKSLKCGDFLPGAAKSSKGTKSVGQ